MCLHITGKRFQSLLLLLSNVKGKTAVYYNTTFFFGAFNNNSGEIIFTAISEAWTEKYRSPHRRFELDLLFYLWVMFLKNDVEEKDVTSVGGAAVLHWWIRYFSCSNSGSHIIHRIEGFSSRVIQVRADFFSQLMTDGFSCFLILVPGLWVHTHIPRLQIQFRWINCFLSKSTQ